MATTVTVGSGLGGFAAIAPQPSYGATFVTPTRTLTMKSTKMTEDPHPMQGGPYLLAGQAVDVGSTRLLTYLDAKGTMTGDVTTIGHALLLATAFGTGDQLKEISASTAYALSAGTVASGTTYIPVALPDTQNGGTSGCCFDMQLGVPTTDGTVHPRNYHSTMITKAEWVFDRTALVTYSYDLDAQYVEGTTGLITASPNTSPAAFSMFTAASAFKVGTFGSEASTDGIKKCTITLERKLATSRIYLGDQYKELPVTNGNVKISVSLEVDYTEAAKTGLFDLLLAGTSTSIVCECVGAEIGSGGQYNTFALCVPNAFEDSGNPALDGQDVVNNTLAWSGTLDSSNDLNGLGLLYITPDSSF